MVAARVRRSYLHCECAPLSLSVQMTARRIADVYMIVMDKTIKKGVLAGQLDQQQTESISTAIFSRRIFELGNPEEINNSNIEARSVESRLGKMEATGSRLQIADCKSRIEVIAACVY